jgi:hypothetical protein
VREEVKVTVVSSIHIAIDVELVGNVGTLDRK